MSTVYVVESTYEGSSAVCAVFSTHEKAIAYVQAHPGIQEFQKENDWSWRRRGLLNITAAFTPT